MYISHFSFDTTLMEKEKQISVIMLFIFESMVFFILYLKREKFFEEKKTL